MKKIGIYKITNPSGKIYIGQSTDIEKRFKNYKNLDCKKQHLIYRSLKKYGFNNHKFEIVAICEEYQLNDFERYYQDLFCVLNKNGLNLKLTETFDKNGILSDFTKEKMSLSKRGIPRTEEIKKKISLSHMGKKMSKESVEKTRLALIGRKLSKEHKEKVLLALSKSRGRSQTEETKRKLSLYFKNRKRKPHSDLAKINISNSLKGRKISEETRKKMSLAQKNRFTKSKLSLHYGLQSEETQREAI